MKALIVLTTLAVTGLAAGQATAATHTKPGVARSDVANSGAIKHTILVNKADNTLRLFITGQPVRFYHVATGKHKWTVEGTFRVVSKQYLSRSGDGPLGCRWLGLNTLGKWGRKQVGIHGTNDPASIGHYASLGCVRMRNADIIEVYNLVPVGTTVRIVNVPPKPKSQVAPPKPDNWPALLRQDATRPKATRPPAVAAPAVAAPLMGSSLEAPVGLALLHDLFPLGFFSLEAEDTDSANAC